MLLAVHDDVIGVFMPGKLLSINSLSLRTVFPRRETSYMYLHSDGRPAQGEKLLGDPAAMQSLAAMVQETGVIGYGQPSTERNKQATEEEH